MAQRAQEVRLVLPGCIALTDRRGMPIPWKDEQSLFDEKAALRRRESARPTPLSGQGTPEPGTQRYPHPPLENARPREVSRAVPPRYVAHPLPFTTLLSSSTSYLHYRPPPFFAESYVPVPMLAHPVWPGIITPLSSSTSFIEYRPPSCTERSFIPAPIPVDPVLPGTIPLLSPAFSFPYACLLLSW